jgi:hypothetical protein
VKEVVMDRKIKKLPELIIHKNQGLEYKLIERIGNVAWYEVRYLGGSVLQGYAVIKIRVRKGGKLPSGKVLTDYEEFPPQSDFGKRGDFYKPESRFKAEKKFSDLVAMSEKRRLKAMAKAKLASRVQTSE